MNLTDEQTLEIFEFATRVVKFHPTRAELASDIEQLFTKITSETSSAESFNSSIQKMENAILENLAQLEQGYGARKWAISKDTGIPEDVLTVLLKRLKDKNKVELMMIWCEHNGTPNGSGYCLKGNAIH